MFLLRRGAALAGAASATALALVAGPVGPVGAAVADPDVAVGGLVTPLSVAVDDDGTVWVSQNFAGLLTRAAPGADAEVVHAVEGHEVGAVSAVDGAATFATTSMDHERPDARLWRLVDGEAVELANLWRHERRTNPDGDLRYGFKGLDRSCKKRFPASMRFLRGYRGIKESHPYATFVDGATTYVADAAGNSLLAVEDGAVHTVAVLPATKVRMTRRMARATGLPGCVTGSTLRLEAVPTDVEAGPDGALYVTTLPGGPEDPSLGANGAVLRVDPETGAVSRHLGGLLSPVGLAIDADGTTYVSMLFAGSVVRQVVGGEQEVVAEVPFPGDVELVDGVLHVTETDLVNDGSAPPDGKVLRLAP